jgi:catechol 2,3-dioxygenase-like lactoylglutathione lyase family enzyme
MTPALQSMVAATYVADIDTSRAFYELLGFQQHSSGKAATSAWSVMEMGGHRVLLVSTLPPLDVPRLPLLFYFFFDDLGAVLGTLAAAGVEAVQLGHPPHALGGEAKVLDPDGNTVLLGQPDRSASQPVATDSTLPHFSLLKEAAALVQARGGTTVTCQVSDLRGIMCRKQADVKLADTRGDTVWACLGHADDILVTVPGAFLAAQDDQGIAAFLRSRRARPDTGAPTGNP